MREFFYVLPRPFSLKQHLLPALVAREQLGSNLTYQLGSKAQTIAKGGEFTQLGPRAHYSQIIDCPHFRLRALTQSHRPLCAAAGTFGGRSWGINERNGQPTWH